MITHAGVELDLLVHHAGLDKALLDRMCLRRFNTRLHVPVSDTLDLELKVRQRKHHLEPGSQLRLSDLRDAYNLPRYAAHDCLIDAIATAELLIASVDERSRRMPGPIVVAREAPRM